MKLKNKTFYAAVLSAVAAGMLAALPVLAEESTRVITDMSGTEVTIPEEVHTYVESWFAHNSIDIMLNGAEGMLVTCADPAMYSWMYTVCDNMSNAEFVTFSADMNVEEILAKDPDVVFGSNENYREMFENVGIPFVNAMFSNYDEMRASIQLTAEVLGGDAPAICEEYLEYLDQNLERVDERVRDVPEEERTTVLHGNDLVNYSVDGGETIINEWINYCGGVNVAAEEVKGNMQTVTMEQILAWNPDVIIDGNDAEEVEAILADDAWASIQAVQDGRVVLNPKGVFTWDRYGVEEALQLLWGAKLLYPDTFEDIDLIKETQDFYEEFFRYSLSEDQVNLILARKDYDGNDTK